MEDRQERDVMRQLELTLQHLREVGADLSVNDHESARADPAPKRNHRKDPEATSNFTHDAPQRSQSESRKSPAHSELRVQDQRGIPLADGKSASAMFAKIRQEWELEHGSELQEPHIHTRENDSTASEIT